MEPFQGRFVLDQSTNDIAIVSRLLAADDHIVAVENAVLDHAVAFDLESKGFLSAGNLIGHRQKSFNVLFRQNRCAGPDASKNGNLRGFWKCRSSVYVEDRNGPFPDSLDIALSFQCLEVVKDTPG